MWKYWLSVVSCSVFFFFFQAEDGIRDYKVTGVQTCALPISCARTRGSMMKFLPVAAATASAICVMSASLKLGVMRCACGACCACCACCAEEIGRAHV